MKPLLTLLPLLVLTGCTGDWVRSDLPNNPTIQDQAWNQDQAYCFGHANKLVPSLPQEPAAPPPPPSYEVQNQYGQKVGTLVPKGHVQPGPDHHAGNIGLSVLNNQLWEREVRNCLHRKGWKYHAK